MTTLKKGKETKTLENAIQIRAFLKHGWEEVKGAPKKPETPKKDIPKKPEIPAAPPDNQEQI